MKLLTKLGIVLIVIGLVPKILFAFFLGIPMNLEWEYHSLNRWGDILIMVGIILLIISGIKRLMKRRIDNLNKQMKETSTKDIQELKDKEIHELKERLDKLEKEKKED